MPGTDGPKAAGSGTDEGTGGQGAETAGAGAGEPRGSATEAAGPSGTGPMGKGVCEDEAADEDAPFTGGTPVTVLPATGMPAAAWGVPGVVVGAASPSQRRAAGGPWTSTPAPRTNAGSSRTLDAARRGAAPPSAPATRRRGSDGARGIVSSGGWARGTSKRREAFAIVGYQPLSSIVRSLEASL